MTVWHYHVSERRTSCISLNESVCTTTRRSEFFVDVINTAVCLNTGKLHSQADFVLSSFFHCTLYFYITL